MIIVPTDTPGLNILRDVPTMEHPRRASAAWAATPRSSTRTCACPYENLLGAEGAGFLIAQQRLVPGRIHHCMRWLGWAPGVRHALRALALALRPRLAAGREADGAELDRRLGRADAGGAPDDAARGLDHGHRGASAARKEISLIKFFGAKVLHDVIDRAIQIHGSLGYSSDLPLEEMYRHARAARMYDGPDEVHRVSVARQILRGYEAPAGGCRMSTCPPVGSPPARSSPICSRR